MANPKRGRGRPPLGADVVRYELKLTAEQLARWQALADASGQVLSEWIRERLDRVRR